MTTLNEEELLQEKKNVVRIMKGRQEWSARDVTTAKACTPVNTVAAKKLLTTLAVKGLGEVFSRGRSPFVFKRKNVDDLNESQKKLCT